MEKRALFAFNGDVMCFVHVLLNAEEMHEQGIRVRIVLEGSATKIISEIRKKDHDLHSLYMKCKRSGLFAGACQACSHKMGALEDIKEEGIKLLADLKGHPSIYNFEKEGYRVVTF